MGDSPRTKAANTLQSQINSPLPFSYNDIASQLEQILGQQTGQLNTEAAADTTSANRGTAARLASEGVTGGSILNNSIANNANTVNKNKYSALSTLLTNYMNQNVGAMNQSNNNQFEKYGLLMNNLGNFSNTNGWDAVFQGLNAIGNVGKGVGSIIKGGS
jgi:hypothetical protein